MTDQESPVRDTQPAPPSDVRFIGEPQDLANLFLALAEAQGEFLPVLKDSTAKVAMKAGGQYTFDYAGLDVVIAATRPALTKYKLALLQMPISGGNELLTVLAHGAARIESVSPLFKWDLPQEFGSAITYAKRYARLGILSVFPAGEDEDGSIASGHKSTVTTRVRAEPPAVRSSAAPVPTPHPDAVTKETADKVLALARKAGFKGKAELDEFSKKHQCGPLDGQTEINALRLHVALESLQVQREVQ